MMKMEHLKNLTTRENFLISLLNKIINEYKLLLAQSRYNKPFKIVDILKLSTIPGETLFAIQISHKNSIFKLTAAEIINSNYSLNDFNDFHAKMIRQAALGKLINFLNLSEENHAYKIVSKRFDKRIQQFIFTIEDNTSIRFNSTADELSKNKNLLANIDPQDVYNIGYTQGAESILKEKMLLASKKI